MADPTQAGMGRAAKPVWGKDSQRDNQEKLLKRDDGEFQYTSENLGQNGQATMHSSSMPRGGGTLNTGCLRAGSNSGAKLLPSCPAGVASWGHLVDDCMIQ